MAYYCGITTRDLPNKLGTLTMEIELLSLVWSAPIVRTVKIMEVHFFYSTTGGSFFYCPFLLNLFIRSCESFNSYCLHRLLVGDWMILTVQGAEKSVLALVAMYAVKETTGIIEKTISRISTT